MEVSAQLTTPAALHPEKEPFVAIEMEAEWAPLTVWKIWCIENSLLYLGLEFRTLS
jgi:hypothetical protein